MTAQQVDSRERLVSPKKAAELLGVHRATLYTMIADGILPKPVKISRGRVGFRQSDIDKVMHPAEK